MKLGQWVFHQITDKNYVLTPETRQRDPEWADESTRRFIDRFAGRLEFSGKLVLDVGCGLGSLCAAAAQHGAVEVVGIDLHNVSRTVAQFSEQYPELAGRVQFVATEGNLDELGQRQFDLVVSKDAMEHFAEPEAFIHRMTRFVKPGGDLAIGFGPFGKARWAGTSIS